MERLLAEALLEGGIEFRHEGEGGTHALDFYLPAHDVYLEVKRFHTDRIASQMSRADNVIVVQGELAVRFIAKHLARKPAGE